MYQYLRRLSFCPFLLVGSSENLGLRVGLDQDKTPFIFGVDPDKGAFFVVFINFSRNNT